MASDRPKALGKYELLSRIAKGGMAEIYLARPRDAVGYESLVVVKRILPHLAEETQFVRMFMEEARLAALLDHNNVVRIHEVGQDDSEYFIAMEYVRGPGVGMINRRARESGVPLAFPVAGEIVAQACDGLHAAHELRDDEGVLLGVVHRDVSPHNLILNEQGVVKLLDFGIAKAHDSAVQTSTGSIKGKFPYMSPEQCRGDPLDRRTDVFSLGIVFFELVTARRLYQRATELMTLKAITEEPIPDPRDYNRFLPAEIADVIMGALQKRREGRFRTAREMGEAVRGALLSLGRSTSSETLSEYVAFECEDLRAGGGGGGGSGGAVSHDEPLLEGDDTEVHRPPRSSHLSDSIPMSLHHLDSVSRGSADSLPVTKPQRRPSRQSADSLPAARGSNERFAVGTSGDRLAVGGSNERLAVGASSGRLAVASSGSELAAAGATAASGSMPRAPAQRGSRGMRLVVGLSVIAVLAGTAAGIAYRLFSKPHLSGPPIKLALTPAFPEKVMRREMADFLGYLSKQLGRRVQLVIPSDYDHLRTGVLSGELDLVVLSPLPFVRARAAEPRLKVLATLTYEGARTYQGMIVRREDSPVRQVTDLRGARFCYVDRGSTSGYLLPRHYLRTQLKVDPDRLFKSTRFSGNHTKVMQDIIAGRCDAGAVYSGAKNAARRLGLPASRLQALAITGQIPYDVVCAAPDTPPALAAAVKRALLAFEPKRDIGRETLGYDIYRITRFVEPHLSEFKAIATAARAEGLLAPAKPPGAGSAKATSLPGSGSGSGSSGADTPK